MKSDYKCIWEYAKDKECTCTECQYCSYYQKEKHNIIKRKNIREAMK